MFFLLSRWHYPIPGHRQRHLKPTGVDWGGSPFPETNSKFAPAKWAVSKTNSIPVGWIGLSSRGRTVGFRVWVSEFFYHFLIFIQGCSRKKKPFKPTLDSWHSMVGMAPLIRLHEILDGWHSMIQGPLDSPSSSIPSPACMACMINNSSSTSRAKRKASSAASLASSFWDEVENRVGRDVYVYIYTYTYICLFVYLFIDLFIYLLIYSFIYVLIFGAFSPPPPKFKQYIYIYMPQNEATFSSQRYILSRLPSFLLSIMWNFGGKVLPEMQVKNVVDLGVMLSTSHPGYLPRNTGVCPWTWLLYQRWSCVFCSLQL